MLRNRSRAVTSKQAIMSDDHTSLPSPTTPNSSSLSSPRFFNGFWSTNHSKSTTAVSSTCILETKNSSDFVNLSGYNKSLEPQAIGLALIDSIIEEESDEQLFKPINRMSLFGSKLKVQIPTISSQSSISPPESAKSRVDFGIKTPNSHLLSPSSTPLKDFSRQLSLKEMELFEDYTCVITHGPNPKTTHIFDNCIVENCSEDHDKMECGFQNS